MFVSAVLASMRRWLQRRSPPRFFFCCCMDSWAPWGDGRLSWGQRADLRHQPDGVPLRSSLRLQKRRATQSPCVRACASGLHSSAVCVMEHGSYHLHVQSPSAWSRSSCYEATRGSFRRACFSFSTGRLSDSSVFESAFVRRPVAEGAAVRRALRRHL